MRLKTSFKNDPILRHDLRMYLRRNLGTMATAVGIFIVLIPLATTCFPGNSIFTQAMQERYAYRLLGENLSLVVYFTMALYGVVLGVLSFSFLKSEPKTDFYFSIGVKRSKLFWSRLLGSLGALIAAVFIPLAISLVLNLVVYGAGSGVIRGFFVVGCALLLQGLVCYALSALACILAGNLAEVVLFNMALQLGMTAMLYGINQLMYHVYWHDARIHTLWMQGEGGVDLLRKFYVINPICFLYPKVVGYGEVPAGDSFVFWPNLFILWGVLLAAFLLAGLAIFISREAEQSGRRGYRTIAVWIGIFVSEFFLFSIVFSLLDSGSRVLAIALGLLTDLVLVFIWQWVLIEQKYPKVWVLVSQCIWMLVAVLVTFGITFAAAMR